MAIIFLSLTSQQNGTLTNCTDYAAALSGDTCASFLTENNITYTQFAAWNPAVEPNCQGLWLSYSYCVSMTNFTLPSSPTTTSSTSSVPVTTPPGPTQSGEPPNCVAWYVAQSGDDCSTVEKLYNITDKQFHAWNPAVSSDCKTGFWAQEAYCVGVSGSSPTTTGTPTTTTTSSVAAPGPTQPNSIASNCNKYAIAPAGGTCFQFAQDNGISVSNLYAWNTVLGPNGENCGGSFWAHEYYCIGVSS